MAETGKYNGYFPAYWAKQREEKSLFTNIIISDPVVFLKMKKKVDLIVANKFVGHHLFKTHIPLQSKWIEFMKPVLKKQSMQL